MPAEKGFSLPAGSFYCEQLEDQDNPAPTFN